MISQSINNSMHVLAGSMFNLHTQFLSIMERMLRRERYFYSFRRFPCIQLFYRNDYRWMHSTINSSHIILCVVLCRGIITLPNHGIFSIKMWDIAWISSIHMIFSKTSTPCSYYSVLIYHAIYIAHMRKVHVKST